MAKNLEIIPINKTPFAPRIFKAATEHRSLSASIGPKNVIG